MKLPKSKLIAIYLLWVIILAALLLNSIKKGYRDSEGFFPIDDLRYFGVTEFIFYSILPLILAYIYVSFVKREKIQPIPNEILNLNNHSDLDTSFKKENITLDPSSVSEISKIQSNKKIIFLKTLFYFLLLVYGSSFYYLNQLFTNDVNVLNQNADIIAFTVIPSMVFSGVGFGIIPLIIIGYKKIKKQSITNKSYLLYLLISLICYLFALRGIYGQYHLMISSSSQIENTAPFIYHQNGNEYKIIFPEPPKISKMSTYISGVKLDGENAEVLLPKDKSFLRCESFCYGSEPFELNDEKTRASLSQVAIAYGLQEPVILYEDNLKFGKVYILNGHKILQDQHNSFHSVMYQVRWYYGKYSAILLTVGSDANSFPTNSISNFINSISLTN